MLSLPQKMCTALDKTSANLLHFFPALQPYLDLNSRLLNFNMKFMLWDPVQGEPVLTVVRFTALYVG